MELPDGRVGRSGCTATTSAAGISDARRRLSAPSPANPVQARIAQPRRGRGGQRLLAGDRRPRLLPRRAICFSPTESKISSSSTAATTTPHDIEFTVGPSPAIRTGYVAAFSRARRELESPDGGRATGRCRRTRHGRWACRARAGGGGTAAVARDHHLRVDVRLRRGRFLPAPPAANSPARACRGQVRRRPLRPLGVTCKADLRRLGDWPVHQLISLRSFGLGRSQRSSRNQIGRR